MSKQAKPKGIELIGPFNPEYYKPTVDGYEIPKLTVIRKTGAKDGEVSVILDDRFIIDVPEDQLDPWLWIVANAMALGAGYSCHGENSVKEPNQFKRKLVGFESSE
jgi:hypothetical protein